MKFLDHILRTLGFKPSMPLPEVTERVGNLTAPQHRALMMAEQAVDLHGHPDLQHAQKAQRLWDAGRPEEALQQFTTALSHAPTDAILHVNRGNLLFQMGRFEEALADYDRAGTLEDLPAELLGNAQMIRTLGVNSTVLRRLAARRQGQAMMTRGGISTN